jgi:hypothetical protein
MLNLNEAGMARYGHDSRYAELLLHIEPRDEIGEPAPAADFTAWYSHLTRALALPAAFARFLTENAKVGTYGDPPAQFAFELNAHRSLTELVDPGGLPVVPGSQQSNQFLGYMLASRDGKNAGDVAVSFTRSTWITTSQLWRAWGYVCEVCGERIQPDHQGKIRLEGVTHANARKAWLWGPAPVHEDCRLRLRTPYDDQVGVEGYIRTWQKMTA